MLSMLKIWDAFLSKQKSVDALHRMLVKNARLTWLDFDLANGCNLVCDHCFYHDNYSYLKEPALSPELLDEAIRQAFEAQIRILTFSGKEPTLSKHLQHAIRSARYWRAQYAPSAKIGLITNGLTLPLHLPFLEKEPLDFLDVSIDGWEYQNLIRSNSRDRVVANLREAKLRSRETRVGTSTAVRNDNYRDIAVMVKNLAAFSNATKGPFEAFYFEPVIAAVDKSVDSLSAANLLAFVKILRQLAEDFRQSDVRFSILLNGDQVIPLFHEGLLEPEDLEEDELGSLYIRQQFGSAQIDFILRIVPEYYWRAARLSYDGYWLGTCDLLQAPNYRELAEGNFAETSDLQQLFTRALQKHSFFYDSIQMAMMQDCGHSPRERQYCLGCFSTALVRMVHQRFKHPAQAEPVVKAAA